jgi:hypothetical protein
MTSERKVTFDLPSIDYVHLINSFHADVDALLVAYDTVMNNYRNNEKDRMNNLDKFEKILAKRTNDYRWVDQIDVIRRSRLIGTYNTMYDMNIKTFADEKQRIKDAWKKFRDANYKRLCYLLDKVEEKYCETDPMFKGMSSRLPWLKMIEDLKSQPIDYFKTIKERSKKLESKFYNTVTCI